MDLDALPSVRQRLSGKRQTHVTIRSFWIQIWHAACSSTSEQWKYSNRTSEDAGRMQDTLYSVYKQWCLCGRRCSGRNRSGDCSEVLERRKGIQPPLQKASGKDPEVPGSNRRQTDRQSWSEILDASETSFWTLWTPGHKPDLTFCCRAGRFCNRTSTL